MNQPNYYRPGNLSDALQLVGEWRDRAQVLAGGTDILISLRRGTVEPEAIIDISAIDELRGIDQQKGYVVIGALTTHSQIRDSVEMKAWAPVLVEACQEVGSPQIRNRGTIGGNVGNASPAGDTIPPLYVLDAEIQLASLQGKRWVTVEDFFTGPGTTVCKPDELITGIRFHPFKEGSKSFFLKIGQRRAVTITKVSAAGILNLEGSKVRSCRLALGAVAPTIIRLNEAEKVLTGKNLTEVLADEAADLAGKTCSPITDIRSSVEYRRRLATVLVRRGLISILQEVEK